MIFSKNYIRLMESLKSEDLYEGKVERRERREARKKERLEKKFNQGGDVEYSSSTGEFNMNAFLKALDALKNQIIAQCNDLDTILKLNPDLKTPGKYKQTFVDLLKRVGRLSGDAAYTRGKEGKKLTAEDSVLISGYRDIYNKIETQFNERRLAYSEEIQKERIQAQKGLEFSGILDPINRASKLFQEALELMEELLTNLAIDFVSSGGGGTIIGDIQILTPIKKWTGGNANETVRKVQKLIYEKFKNDKVVSASSVWKKFLGTGKESSYADGKNGTNTSKLIVALKAGLGMADTSSDITQEFVNQLYAMKESINLNESIVSFDDFINAKTSEVKEGFDPDAFKAAAGVTKKPAGTTTSGSTVGASIPFTTKEEGDAFRQWVNDKHADWAKENKLDPSGSYNNAYIKKAWNEFGEKYKEEKDLPELLPVEYKPLYDVLIDYLSDKEGNYNKGFIKIDKAKGDNSVFKPGDVYIRLISKNYPLAYEFNLTQNKWGCWEYPNFADKNGEISGKSTNIAWGTFSELGKKVGLSSPQKIDQKQFDEISLNNFFGLSNYVAGYTVGDVGAATPGDIGLNDQTAKALEKYYTGTWPNTPSLIQIKFLDDDKRPAFDYLNEKDFFIIKRGWNKPDFGYVVLGKRKDTNGKLGGVYVFAPDFVAEYGMPKKEDAFSGKAAVIKVEQKDTSNLKDLFIRTDADDEKASSISQTIVNKFNETSFWKPFKGTFNDDESAAISAFTRWWDKNIDPKIKEMKSKDPNKKILDDLLSTINRKMEGSTSNDTARWTIEQTSGSKKYSVDTDF